MSKTKLVISLVGMFGAHTLSACTEGQIGQDDSAEQLLVELVEQSPNQVLRFSDDFDGTTSNIAYTVQGLQGNQPLSGQAVAELSYKDGLFYLTKMDATIEEIALTLPSMDPTFSTIVTFENAEVTLAAQDSNGTAVAPSIVTITGNEMAGRAEVQPMFRGVSNIRTSLGWETEYERVEVAPTPIVINVERVGNEVRATFDYEYSFEGGLPLGAEATVHIHYIASLPIPQ